jgi:hypothetical protein
MYMSRIAIHWLENNMGTPLYSHCTDHIENIYYFADILPLSCLANSLCAYCYSTGHAVYHIENTSSIVRNVERSNELQYGPERTQLLLLRVCWNV